MAQDTPTHIAIVYHSGFGHTALQAEAVAEGARSVPGANVVVHTAAEAKDDLVALENADAIIFGTPTYMGSASAELKAFMETSSRAWFERKWVGKIAGGFTNSSSLAGDKLSTLSQLAVFAAQHGMIWVSQGEPNESAAPGVTQGDPEAMNRSGFYLGAVAQSRNGEAGPDNPPKGDIATAHAYGARIAAVTAQFKRGAA